MMLGHQQTAHKHNTGAMDGVKISVMTQISVTTHKLSADADQDR